jgi:hypothetical protein
MNMSLSKWAFLCLDEHYSEDFDGSDKVEKSENGHSSNSDGKKITTRESSAKVRLFFKGYYELYVTHTCSVFKTSLLSSE